MARTFIRCTVWFVYLIKLARPLGGMLHKASFYLGMASDWVKRYRQHCKGRGSRMLACAAERGIPFSVVKLWKYASLQEAHKFEMWAKLTLKNHKRLLRRPDDLDGEIERMTIVDL